MRQQAQIGYQHNGTISVDAQCCCAIEQWIDVQDSVSQLNIVNSFSADLISWCPAATNSFAFKQVNSCV